jgi:hypothetical protein
LSGLSSLRSSVLLLMGLLRRLSSGLSLLLCGLLPWLLVCHVLILYRVRLLLLRRGSSAPLLLRWAGSLRRARLPLHRLLPALTLLIAVLSLTLIASALLASLLVSNRGIAGGRGLLMGLVVAVLSVRALWVVLSHKL